jgi:ribosomal protein S12 methylthiotransferase
MATILAEAQGLVDAGASEIGLVAQDSGMWSEGDTGLVDLTRTLAEGHPDIWWRVYYIHPAHFPSGLTALIESHDNVMPWIDMPVQHTEPAILERMGRPYGRDDLHRILGGLQDSCRRIAARITVIAGYPGETPDEFSSLVDFLSGYGCIRSLIAFPYFPEEGTAEYDRAAGQGDMVPEHEVVERLSVLSTLSEAFLADWGDWLTGREITVLADTPASGHTVWDAPFVDSVCLFSRSVEAGSHVRGQVTGIRGSDVLLDPVRVCRDSSTGEVMQ